MGPIDHIYAICDSEYQKCALQQESEEGPLLLQINLEETERKVSFQSSNRLLLSTITLEKPNHLTTPNSEFVVKYQIFPNVTAKKSEFNLHCTISRTRCFDGCEVILPS